MSRPASRTAANSPVKYSSFHGSRMYFFASNPMLITAWLTSPERTAAAACSAASSRSVLRISRVYLLFRGPLYSVLSQCAHAAAAYARARTAWGAAVMYLGPEVGWKVRRWKRSTARPTSGVSLSHPHPVRYLEGSPSVSGG